MYVKKNKNCPICEKGILTKQKTELGSGLYADALVCNSCKKIFYSKEVMRQIEKLEYAGSDKRKLVRVGNSLAAIIPSVIVKSLHLKEKEPVWVREKNNTILIQLIHKSK